MVTLFGMLETGIRGLFSQQAGISVTGNNISNVNTPGFSRQRVNLVTTPDLDAPPLPTGTGAQVASIERFRSEFLDLQIRDQKSDFGYFSQMGSLYAHLETILNDPITASTSSLEDTAEAGLNATLIYFFDALQELSLEPESTAVRSSVREVASTLAATFNLLDQQMADLQVDVNTKIEDTVSEINTYLDSILEVNMQIARLEVEEDSNANNLRDQRDLLITELSQLVPVDVTELESGAVNVSIFGINAVQPLTVNHLVAVPRQNDPYQFVDIVSENGGGQILNTQITTGQLGALLEARDEIVPDYQAQIDELAYTLINEINAIHSGSAGQSGFTQTTGEIAVSNPALVLDVSELDFDVQAGSFDLVVRDADGNFANQYTITVDPATDSLNDLALAIDNADGVPGGGDLTATVNAANQLVISAGTDQTFTIQGDDSGVLAALGVNVFFTGTDAGSISLSQLIQNDLSKIAASADGTLGNNEAALEMAQLRQAALFESDTADFNAYYQSTIAKLGTESRRTIQLEQNTALLVNELELRQEELAGVSIDEETVNLMMFQRAFSAASRFITSVDELIRTVVESMGLVGR